MPPVGSFGRTFTEALVNTTCHVRNLVGAVPPDAVGGLLSSSAAALGALNMTEVADAVEQLLQQASAIAAEVAHSINPEDVQQLMHNVAEVDLNAQMNRALDLVNTALSMVKRMGMTNKK
jgi:hypothetical protein